jgi:hypothetical protein
MNLGGREMTVGTLLLVVALILFAVAFAVAAGASSGTIAGVGAIGWIGLGLAFSTLAKLVR